MKISQAFKLGHKSIMGHKRRNFTTIVIISLLFGLHSGIIFTLQGTESAILRAANETYGPEYYVGVMTNFRNKKLCRQEPIPDQPNSYNDICSPSIASDSAKIVQSYSGKILSQSSSYATILSPEDVPPFISTDLSDIPENTIAVLASPQIIAESNNTDFNQLSLAQRASFIRNEFTKNIGTTVELPNRDQNPLWYVAGILPSSTIIDTYDGPGQSLNPFDMILQFLGIRTGGELSQIYLNVDSPTTREKIKYLEQQDSFAENATFILAKFPNADSARRFADHEICGQNSSSCTKPFLAYSSFDNRLDLREVARVTWSILSIIESVIIMIASIIMLFTFIKVLGDQSSEIRLYRSLGASRLDICLIYGAYLLEVCLYAIGFMFLLGLLIAGLISLLNAAAFTDVLTVAYGKVFTWPKVLIGWNPLLIKLITSMLAVAGISLLWFTITRKYQKTR